MEKSSALTEYGKIICVVGPTASGKSALAIELAKSFNGEIISCDSMQLYKNMDVGTAKVTKEEMCGIPHHLLDIMDIMDEFSVSDYVDIAEKTVIDVKSRGKLPIFCGGTGLYIDSFVSGMQFGEYGSLPEYRTELEAYAAENGCQALHEMLSACDAAAAEKIAPENVKRVIRALEVFKATGEPISVWNKRAYENAKPKDALYIGITYCDRQKLYDRIDQRVEIMLENGIVDETRKLVEMGIKKSKTAGQAIGYKEFYPYIEGESSLEECVERLKINSRHYAKRQLTWFNRNKNVRWVYPDEGTVGEYIVKAFNYCKDFLDGNV